eukprot:XP_016662128.1 PREDICTED: MOB kinase activator-like 1 [Acyrthosiphon pisum]
MSVLLRECIRRDCLSRDVLGKFIMNIPFRGRLSKTLKPKKNILKCTNHFNLMKHASKTLGSSNLRFAVRLPKGEDINEWIAFNTVDFFNQINMYGTLTEFCTDESCSTMSAGPKYEYHWVDGLTDQLDDETLFPARIGDPFPKNFISIAKTILKRLLRVYAQCTCISYTFQFSR